MVMKPMKSERFFDNIVIILYLSILKQFHRNPTLDWQNIFDINLDDLVLISPCHVQ